MQVTKPYIAKIARDFWNKFEKSHQSTLGIIDAINIAFPVDFVILPNLTLGSVQTWLQNRNVYMTFDANDRILHGLIVVHQSNGLIFLDENDSRSDREYTAAHEISHYLLDYKIPRERIMEKMGSSIMEVLDGKRDATSTERIDALLNSINVRAFSHLLEKDGDGSFVSSEVFDAENDADALALELLAPSSKIIAKVKSTTSTASFHSFQDCSLQILREEYFLPEQIAKEYSKRLAYSVTGGPSLLSKLGF